MAKIQCEECGKWVDYDEELDAPVDHPCVDDNSDDESLASLNFDE